MGMFDSIFIPCPNCKETVEVQSKAGPCTLKAFDPDKVPAVVAVDVDGDETFCNKCKKSWVVRTKKLKPVYRVKLVDKARFEEEDDA
jgi:hypothetical protein